MRGLGCPVGIILTAGQKGDVPQAAPLLEDRRADFVMADTAYDADHFRDRIAKAGAIAVIPSNPSRAKKLPLDKARSIRSACFGNSRTPFSLNPGQ